MPQITRILNDADSGQTITLAPGEPFALALSGNPTSGYRWEIDAYNPRLLKPLGPPGYTQEDEGVGSGGLFRFAFQATATGHTTLKLIYHRPFEQGVKPLRTFTVKVVIE